MRISDTTKAVVKASEDYRVFVLEKLQMIKKTEKMNAPSREISVVVPKYLIKSGHPPTKNILAVFDILQENTKNFNITIQTYEEKEFNEFIICLTPNSKLDTLIELFKID